MYFVLPSTYIILKPGPISSVESRDNYKLFFEHAPDGVVLIDQYNRIQFWNPKAEAIFGWTSEEVVGKVLSTIIVPPAFRKAHDNGMKRYLATGEVRVLNKTIEVPSLHRRGYEFYISLTISKVEVNGVTNFLAFIRDITEQKAKQTQLDQKTLELERSNIQLQEFASIASHDLKEPLRKIVTFVDLVITSEKEALSEKAGIYLHKVMGSAIRMQQLTDGILSYSSIGEKVQKEKCSLEDIFNDVLNNLENRIKETSAFIKTDGLPEADVVPLQIQQLFQNLISNALKFSKKEEAPQILVTHSLLAPTEVNGKFLQPSAHYLQINFKDNGIGIEKESTEKIFGLFQRLHGKSAYEGSGLGLAICRRIVENHGGLISATSELGKGAEFAIVLPYVNTQ